jgi:Zn-dependent peptidase ImmA (M78 family)/DNA-binding XRE family transcriptional regulator
MFGQRLKLARRKAGLSMQALADRLSPPLSAQAISKYESGKMLPSSGVLVGLGQALGVSLDFLMGGQVEALEAVEFRRHSGTSAQDRARAEAIVTEKLENYLAIEEILELESVGDAFAAARVASVTAPEEIDEVARTLREKWKLGIDPIPSLTALLEDKGVKVIEAELPDRFDGLACKVRRGGDRPAIDVIVVSRASSVERKRFSLAHELGHRVIADSAIDGLSHEKAMHRFAAAFIAPAEHLVEEVGKSRRGITFHEIMRLKRVYGMSAAAMLIRLRNVGIVDEGVVHYAFKTYARPWRNREPEPIRPDEGFSAFETPQRFERLVWRALAEELISPVRAAQMLGCTLGYVEREMRGPSDP